MLKARVLRMTKLFLIVLANYQPASLHQLWRVRRSLVAHLSAQLRRELEQHTGFSHAAGSHASAQRVRTAPVIPVAGHAWNGMIRIVLCSRTTYMAKLWPCYARVCIAVASVLLLDLSTYARERVHLLYGSSVYHCVLCMHTGWWHQHGQYVIPAYS